MSRRINSKTCKLFAALALAIGASSACGSVISDTDFVNSDWTHSTLWTTGTTSTGPIGQVLTGGNPDEYQQGRQTAYFGALVYGHLYVGGGTYDPGSQGAVAFLDVSYDYIDLVGVGTQSGLLIKQGNRFFTYYVNSSQWFQWTGLSANGIVDVWSARWEEFTGGVYTNFTTPDFSSSGLPMTFGYYTFNQSDGAHVDRTWGIDNFTISITTVPGPSSLPIVTLCGAVAITRQRTRGRTTTQS